MPNCDRPHSPAEPISENYSISRMEQDLYELVEEQQALLDVMARERERLERHLEIRRVLMNEQPMVGLTTPLPELTPLQIDEIIDEPPQSEMPVVTEVAPSALQLVKVEEPQEQQQLALVKWSETATNSWAKPNLDQQRQRSMVCVSPIVLKYKNSKCTPPKRYGLGYDTPFPYPKRLGKSRERRALYIFTLCQNLAMHLKDHIRLNRSGNGSSVIITELNLKPQLPKLALEPPNFGVSSGALPKSRRLEKFVKRLPPKQLALKQTSTSYKLSSYMEPEIDLDCEFGMEHIEMFRRNSMRQEQRNFLQAKTSTSDVTTQGHMYAENMKLAMAMSELAISENNNNPPMQQQQLTLPGWNENDMFVAGSGSQQATRPSTPQMDTGALMPACVLSNGCINTMPSTSAQARAMSLSMLNQPGSLDISLENFYISPR